MTKSKYLFLNHCKICFIVGDDVGEPEVVGHRQLLHESRLSQSKHFFSNTRHQVLYGLIETRIIFLIG